jgi:hypothetical protein
MTRACRACFERAQHAEHGACARRASVLPRVLLSTGSTVGTVTGHGRRRLGEAGDDG